ncbi:GNAT family N-acetyltransferase [bacterium]|nr:GNAT family N-acetyltransferase [bacterium]
MHEYINLNADNLACEHLCCAIGDPKHQVGVACKKEWLKNKLADGHVFRKLDARGKTFIEYEPVETAWVPVVGHHYFYIYCLWVAGSFKGQGIARELLDHAITDARKKKLSGLCTLVAAKKKPFLGEKKFFVHFGFRVVDSINDYELLALSFDDQSAPRFSDTARRMAIDNPELTIYYSHACPFVAHQIDQLRDYAAAQNVPINFVHVDSLEKAKNVPGVFNNWATFYRGHFVSHQILNVAALEKILATN